jgi:gamma-glutamyltranspeptidase/glutathione hydrolase
MIRQYSGYLQDILAGAPPPSEPGLAKGPANTTHISVADDDGLVVSITTSAGESAGFVVGQTGIMLNNMLGEIDLHFNGFHQLPPGQRLTTMMSPAIILQEGQPVLVVGSGGSNRLRSAIVQTISNVLDFGLPLAEAVAAPRIHFEENMLQLEGGIGPDVAQSLAAGGYQVNRWPARNMFFGGAHAVARQPDNHSQPWVAVGDARRGGAIAAE